MLGPLFFASPTKPLGAEPDTFTSPNLETDENVDPVMGGWVGATKLAVLLVLLKLTVCLRCSLLLCFVCAALSWGALSRMRADPTEPRRPPRLRRQPR